VVRLAGVTRSFGSVRALAGFDLSVERGTVTALLGPNGAGKTTSVRVITGGLGVQGGSVRVFGLDPATDGETVRARCGVVGANPALYDRLSGRDNLLYSARLFGLGERAPIETAAARFGIDAALELKVGTYSTGMKTGLARARATLDDPELVRLDEPTAGLDPESARAVLALIREMASGGKTVVLCTHLLLEAEGLADQIVVMDRGTALVSGAPAELANRYWPHPAVVLDAEDRSRLEEVRACEGVVGFELDGSAIVRLDDLRRVPDLIARLTAAGVRLTRVEPRAPTLEDIYFAVRGGQR
jgi:ABC-2 type transport system ATP-binding protein